MSPVHAAPEIEQPFVVEVPLPLHVSPLGHPESDVHAVAVVTEQKPLHVPLSGR